MAIVNGQEGQEGIMEMSIHDAQGFIDKVAPLLETRQGAIAPVDYPHYEGRPISDSVTQIHPARKSGYVVARFVGQELELALCPLDGEKLGDVLTMPMIPQVAPRLRWGNASKRGLSRVNTFDRFDALIFTIDPVADEPFRMEAEDEGVRVELPSMRYREAADRLIMAYEFAKLCVDAFISNPQTPLPPRLHLVQ